MLCHYYYFKSLQPLKTINIQEFKNKNFTYDRCVLYIKTIQTDEKKKSHADNVVKVDEWR